MASNRNSSGGVYVKMSSYTKSYDLMPDNELPEKIYLDKYNEYSFSVFLSIATTEDGCERPGLGLGPGKGSRTQWAKSLRGGRALSPPPQLLPPDFTPPPRAGERTQVSWQPTSLC